MNPVKHASNNIEFGKPVDWDEETQGECLTLPVTQLAVDEGYTALVSFWQPDPEELKLINERKSITLWIYGISHPVVSLGVDMGRPWL